MQVSIRSMTAFLDGISSLEYWRFCASASNSASAVRRNNRCANETYSKAKISTTDIDTISLALPKLSKPYHLLSASPDLRTRSKQAQSRIAKASDIPPGSFIKIGKGRKRRGGRARAGQQIKESTDAVRLRCDIIAGIKSQIVPIQQDAVFPRCCTAPCDRCVHQAFRNERVAV